MNKYADDICLAGFISCNNNIMYEEDVQRLTSWCSEKYMQFNVKNKEIVIDFRKNRNPPLPLLTVSGETVERAATHKYLGVTIHQN